MFKHPRNKTPFTRISMAMAMVVAVFLQMGFVSVTTMECFSSGKEKIFLGEKKSCCASEMPASAETVARQCCDVFSSAASFHTYKPSQEQTLAFDIAAAIPFVLSEIANFSPDSLYQRFPISHVKVPSIPGRQILIQICKYTI